jgi:hypothetical protein
VFEIEADDLANDDTVGVRYLGTSNADTSELGGTLAVGKFQSNRTRDTRKNIETVLHLPVFADADPLTLTILGTEIDLVADGRGGFDGVMRGAIRVDDALDTTARGLEQMIAANPRDHLVLGVIFDANHDGTITVEEIRNAQFLQASLRPDVQMFVDGVFAPTPTSHTSDPRDSVSIAFGFHIAPCANGNCALGTPNTCFDRLPGTAEAALDCGGTCALKCAGGATCVAASDCQTGTCDNGHCSAPTCSDGLADGFEGDVDCGGPCATKCAAGKRCNQSSDCASNSCNNGICKP